MQAGLDTYSHAILIPLDKHYIMSVELLEEKSSITSRGKKQVL